MKVTIEKPEILVLGFRQEKSDPDYGSCMWARFYLDLNNYTMSIESDCGNYSYGWVPTPKTEPFLALLCRMHTDYLLKKIANKTVVDGDETFKNVKQLVEDVAVDLSELELEDIEAACHAYNDTRDIVTAVYDAIFSEEDRQAIEEYSLWCCVTMDYKADAKKIVSVFDTCIRPKLKELKERENNDRT